MAFRLPVGQHRTLEFLEQRDHPVIHVGLRVLLRAPHYAQQLLSKQRVEFWVSVRIPLPAKPRLVGNQSQGKGERRAALLILNL